MSARKTGSGHSPEMAKSDFAGSSEPRQYVPESESDSDEHVPCVDVVAGSGSARRSQVIHSGHFMVSSPHSDSVKRRDPALNRHDGFNTASKPDGQKYWFGPLSSKRLTVDPSLTTLFECMTLAYSGKIVSPKWKSFKGLRLLWRDKIRLNNGIWRAWFIQYVEKRKNPVCGFITPLDGSEAEAHGKPQAIVLEGSYWKRQIEVVTKEYHKWRIYYKKRLQKNKDLLSMLKSPIDRTGLEKWTSQMYVDPETRGEEVHMFDLDCFLSDISDTLFTMTQKPSPWSEDWQNSYTSNADMIQPGLTPLQPNLDDLMDIPDIFLSFRGPQSDPPGYSDFSFCDSFSDGMFPSTASSALSTPMMHSSSLLTESLSEKGFPQACISLIPPGTSFSRQNMIPDMTFNPSADFSHSTAPYDPPESLGTQTKEVPAFMPHESSYPVPSLLQYKQSSSQSQNSMATMAAVITHTSSPLSSECTGMSGSYSSGLSQRFLLPQRMDVVTGRGKCKQKSVGVGTAMTSPKAPPTQTSCLTNLLTSISQEQKSRNFDAAASTGYKTRRPVSPLSPLQPNSSSGRGSQLSHNPPWGQVTSLLIPKTEQLSPVQMPDRLALPGPFSGGFRQTSPTNPPEKNPEAFSGPLKIDAGRDEPRRITHISAEQKRRFNIKLGFDTLQGLVSTLSSQPSVKISKALTLQKTAEYISKMQQERAQLHDEAQRLREQIQHLNAAINVCQQQLPATGVPITRQRFHHMREKFREYVRTQTLQNWKFWIFSLMIEPLFESFNSVVSTSSVEDLCGSSLSWLEQHCSLLALRPAVLSSLRLLSTSTSILSDPSLLPEQAIQAANHRPLSPSYSQ